MVNQFLLEHLPAGVSRLVDNTILAFGGVLQPVPAALVAGSANVLWKVFQVPRNGAEC